MLNAWQTLPERFRERASKILNPADLHRWIDGFANAPPMAVRYTAEGHGGDAFRGTLEDAGLAPRPVGFLEDAFHLDQGDRVTVRHLDLYKSGGMVLQSASSMAAVCALDPQASEDVMDLCAAPGGKTALMHRRMKGAGRLVANDSSRRRLGRLRDQLATLNIDGVQVLCQVGASLAHDLTACFDRVLVDVPCSGSGRWHAGESAAWAKWTPSTARSLARRQVSLLRAALRMVRPGGFVVYSTCTLAPEENEGVVSTVLSKAPIEASCIELPFEPPASRSALTHWQGRQYPPGVVNCRRIAPLCQGMTGFFIALLQRA